MYVRTYRAFPISSPLRFGSLVHVFSNLKRETSTSDTPNESRLWCKIAQMQTTQSRKRQRQFSREIFDSQLSAKLFVCSKSVIVTFRLAVSCMHNLLAFRTLSLIQTCRKWWTKWKYTVCTYIHYICMHQWTVLTCVPLYSYISEMHGITVPVPSTAPSSYSYHNDVLLTDAWCRPVIIYIYIYIHIYIHVHFVKQY